MHSRKTVPIIDLMDAANMELIRLDFKSSTLSLSLIHISAEAGCCSTNRRARILRCTMI